ncbi:molecular chaperone TorD [Otariodibacter oris]|uniref:Tat proofreading chaperone TorD n=1 Tax=Otariodibacter oris TaxID=1032623 RepID=A0A420XGC9_9PAST|nr:molecular chaperone TorD [Otariodibacter oris]QGM79958.1 molecular chaperone TorD [Otariodibacter oris]RKR71779.1 Tat proofreading chaperone TorD [Otariodibacter oris]
MIEITSEERLFVYSWLSNVLGHELSKQQLEQYQNGSFDEFFDFLAQQGFSEEIKGIKQSLSDIKEREFSHLELAADYTQLFLLDGEVSALPYASVYLDEVELSKNLAFLDDLLIEFGLQVNKETHEPSDHLCVYIELLIKIIESSDQELEQEFVQIYFLPWLQRFVLKVKGIKTQTDFYPQIINILVGLLSKA